MSDSGRTPEDERGSVGGTDASKPLTQVGAALASLAEGWLRDTATCGVVLLSLGVVLGALSAEGTAWVAVGVVLGLAAAVMAVVPTVRHWRVARIWATLLVVAALDLAAILLLARG